jgi:hypothetical protein
MNRICLLLPLLLLSTAMAAARFGSSGDKSAIFLPCCGYFLIPFQFFGDKYDICNEILTLISYYCIG